MRDYNRGISMYQETGIWLNDQNRFSMETPCLAASCSGYFCWLVEGLRGCPKKKQNLQLSAQDSTRFHDHTYTYISSCLSLLRAYRRT